MLHALLTLLAAASVALSTTPPSAECDPARFLSGDLLRCHIVAADDTVPMQRVKLIVRDALLDRCAGQPLQHPMLEDASARLDELQRIAASAAREAGFTGAVSVTIEQLPFDERTSGKLTLPAGDYPALMVRLGDAAGQNWWGLLDPELAMRFGCIGEDGSSAPPRWDWSLKGLLRALFERIAPGEGG